MPATRVSHGLGPIRSTRGPVGPRGWFRCHRERGRGPVRTALGRPRRQRALCRSWCNSVVAAEDAAADVDARADTEARPSIGAGAPVFAKVGYAVRSPDSAWGLIMPPIHW